MNVSFNAHIPRVTAPICKAQYKRNNAAVSFQANIPDVIAPIYKTQQSKKNTVAILGSSKSTDSISKYIQVCYNFVKKIILDGKNIVTGCGIYGIMGAAYAAAKEFSAKDEEGKPIQNLVIVTKTMYGDEDTDNCIPLMAANNEAERTEKFLEVADTIIIFPGSVTTLQETATMITKNYYSKEDKKKIILVGKEFFEGLIKQYNCLYEAGLIKCKPSELFTIVDSKEEVEQIIQS